MIKKHINKGIFGSLIKINKVLSGKGVEKNSKIMKNIYKI
jgi:hypothetical protein